MKGERQVHKNTLEKFKATMAENVELNVQCNQHQRTIEEWRLDKEEFERLKDTVKKYREENDKLHEAIETMSGRPFSEDSVKQQELQWRQAHLEERIREQETENEALKKQIKHFEVEKEGLMARSKQLRENTIAETRRADELLLDLEESKLPMVSLQEQLSIFCDHADQDIVRALAKVVKAQMNPCEVDVVLEKTEPQDLDR